MISEKQGEPYNCQSLLPEGNFQAAMQGTETQTEPNNLAELMR